MKVRKRSSAGNAVQWTDLEEMQKTMKGQVGLSGGQLLSIESIDGLTSRTAVVGTWIVMMDDGGVELHDDSFFDRTFQAA